MSPKKALPDEILQKSEQSSGFEVLLRLRVVWDEHEEHSSEPVFVAAEEGGPTEGFALRTPSSG